MISTIIYLAISIVVTVLVGYDLHKNGYYLILNLFDNEVVSKTLNNMLLIGYYLVNIGYVAINVAVPNSLALYEHIELVAYKTATIVLILGVLHFNNIIMLTLLSKNKQKIISIFNN